MKSSSNKCNDLFTSVVFDESIHKNLLCLERVAITSVEREVLSHNVLRPHSVYDRVVKTVGAQRSRKRCRLGSAFDVVRHALHRNLDIQKLDTPLGSSLENNLEHVLRSSAQ